MLEYCADGSLADRMRASSISEVEAREIIRQLAEAVAHLHDANILHRDLKPSNVLARSLVPPQWVLTDEAEISLRLVSRGILP